MVGSGHVVKLGDFGMARAMYDSDYYRFGRKGKTQVDFYTPVRINPRECKPIQRNRKGT